MTCSATAILTVKIGQIEFNVRADFDVDPGEPMVRYYADGSGYPGSPPSVDYITDVECLECEWPNDSPDEWGYSDLEDRPGVKEIAERWIYAELSSGSYDDELMENAEGEDYV